MRRTANIALAAITIFFAVLQYNDPDPLYWGAVYLLAALFPLLALPRAAPLSRMSVLRVAGWLCTALFLLGFASLVGTISADWIHVEEAREALGYLICAAAAGFALFSTRAQTRSPGPIRS